MVVLEDEMEDERNKVRKHVQGYDESVTTAKHELQKCGEIASDEVMQVLSCGDFQIFEFFGVSTSDPEDTNEGKLASYLSRVGESKSTTNDLREGSNVESQGRHISVATS